MIEFRNTQIGYDKILFEIPKLDLEQGKLYGIFGANGSGKSTLLKNIIGENIPINGELKIDKIEIRERSLPERAKLISLVQSQFSGVAFMTVLEYLKLGRIPHVSFNARLNLQDLQKVEEVIELFNLGPLLTKMTQEISDGERQLCNIAKSLISESPYILLDEPTSFLDYRNKEKVINKLLEISIKFQKCVVMTNHDLDIMLEHDIEILLIDPESRILKIVENKNRNKEFILNKAFFEL